MIWSHSGSVARLCRGILKINFCTPGLQISPNCLKCLHYPPRWRPYITRDCLIIGKPFEACRVWCIFMLIYHVRDKNSLLALICLISRILNAPSHKVTIKRELNLFQKSVFLLYLKWLCFVWLEGWLTSLLNTQYRPKVKTHLLIQMNE